MQQQIGEMELKSLASRQFLFGIAAQYEEYPQKDYKVEIAAVKTLVTNQAIVMSQQNPLHRYYQNVRAGLHWMILHFKCLLKTT